MNIIWKATLHMTAWGILSGTILGALYGGGVLLFTGAGRGSITGVLFGALFGGVSGLGLGFICGIVVGLVARLFFYPPTRHFRWTLVVLCPLLTFGMALGIFSQILTPNMVSEGVQILTIPPALIAALAAGLAGQQFARQYAQMILNQAGTPQPKVNQGGKP